MSVPQAWDFWKVYVVLKMVKLDPAMKTVSNFISPNFVVTHCRLLFTKATIRMLQGHDPDFLSTDIIRGRRFAGMDRRSPL